MFGIDDIVSVGMKLVDKLIPDPQAKAQAQLDLAKLAQEGKSVVVTKESTPVNLLAGKWHEIEALEDGTVFVNIFAQGN